MPLTSQLSVNVAAKQTAPLDLGPTDGLTANVAKNYAVSLLNGTLAGQADRLFQDTRTIAASSNDDLDLANVLLDVFGATLTFARIKALVVSAAAGNTNDVLVGGAATNTLASLTGATTDKIRLRPGATFALLAGAADLTGYTVVATTGDLLRVANSGAGSSVTYDIVVIGCSA